MKLNEIEIEKLRGLIPNFKSQLAGELEISKAVATNAVKRTISVHSPTLSASLITYDNYCAEGYEPIHNNCYSCTNPAVLGYSFTYLLPKKKIAKLEQEAIKKVEEAHEKRVATLKNEALDDLIGEHLQQKKAAAQVRAKEEEKLLKEKLLSQLFS